MLIPVKNGQGKLSLSSHSWKISLLFVLSQNIFGSLGRTSWHGKHLWYNPSNDSVKKCMIGKFKTVVPFSPDHKKLKDNEIPFHWQVWLTIHTIHWHLHQPSGKYAWLYWIFSVGFPVHLPDNLAWRNWLFFEIKRHSVIGLVVDRSVTSSLGHHRLCWLLAATSEYHGALAPAFFDVWKEPLLTWNPYSILKELHKLYHMGLVALMHGILATIMVH